MCHGGGQVTGSGDFVTCIDKHVLVLQLIGRRKSKETPLNWCIGHIWI